MTTYDDSQPVAMVPTAISQDGLSTLSAATTTSPPLAPTLADKALALEERLTDVERRANSRLVERMDAIGDTLSVIEDKIKAVGLDTQRPSDHDGALDDHEQPFSGVDNPLPVVGSRSSPGVPRGKKGPLSCDDDEAWESSSSLDSTPSPRQPELESERSQIEDHIGALQTRLEHGVGRLEDRMSALEEKLFQMERKVQERVEIVEGKMDQLVGLLEGVLGAGGRRASSSQAEDVEAGRIREQS